MELKTEKECFSSRIFRRGHPPRRQALSITVVCYRAVLFPSYQRLSPPHNRTPNNIKKMKEKQDVISDFNELVNMTGSELESWLKSDDSNSAGWPKSDGDEDGESVGHESGRKIVEILNSNPKKDAEKYTDDQVEHMRKVVAYWYGLFGNPEPQL